MTMYNESLRAFFKPVLAYLDDESVTEILINGPEDVWIERKGRLQKTDARFSEEALLGAARNVAQFVGRTVTEERPRLDARLPDGSRIHVVLAPVARKGTTIAIRKFFKESLDVDALKRFGALSGPMARLLEAAIQLKLNVIVAGGTGSGKTTLLNILSSLIPNDERILTIEDSAELRLVQEHLVPFESRPADKQGKGEVNMGDLLNSALRLRPDRIVVGEVRGGECFHLMQALNTGHGGSLATVHANTATDTLRRLESLSLMNSVELPMVAVRAQVASAIHMVLVCERLSDGSRKVVSLSEVLPLSEKGDYRTQDLFVYTVVAKDEEGALLGYHAPTGIVPTFATKARALGFGDLDERFFDPATYGLPPPPLYHLGSEHQVRWAGSLKHREKGLPDPGGAEAALHSFEKRLREEARAKRAAAPPVSPKPKPAAPPAKAPQRSAPRAPPKDDDLTPPPTRNPLLSRPSSKAEIDDSKTDSRPALPIDEPKVEVAEDLLNEAMEDLEAEPVPRPLPTRRPENRGSSADEKTSIRPLPDKFRR